MTAPLPTPAEAAVVARFGIFAEEETVERVALAIWNTRMRDEMTANDWCKALCPEDREFYREQGRAALAAMSGVGSDAIAALWRVEALVADFASNGNGCPLGDSAGNAWHKASNLLRAALRPADVTGGQQ